VAATVTSDGCELGRHSGRWGQRLRALHDPVVILLDKKHHMRVVITPEKGKERAQKHFTDGISSGGGEEAEAVARGECGGSGGQRRMRV
jgi:hypothetical protein